MAAPKQHTPLGRRGGLWPLFLLALSMTWGCNHLFYYPDALIYATPERLGLRYHEHQITKPDGHRLALWHILPGVTPKAGTTVVQLHGNAQNMTAHFLYVAWLAAAGYDVISFDYSGYGASSGEPSQDALVADGAAVLRWLRQHQELGSQPIALLGQSLGGAVAVPLAAKHQDAQLKVVVLDSTFFSYRQLARAKLSEVWLTWPLQWPLSWLVSDDVSPADTAATLATHNLVVHAPRDPVVPYTEGKKLYAALPAKQRELWTVDLDQAQHLAAFAQPDSPWRARLLAYLCKHTGGCGKPQATPY